MAELTPDEVQAMCDRLERLRLEQRDNPAALAAIDHGNAALDELTMALVRDILGDDGATPESYQRIGSLWLRSSVASSPAVVVRRRKSAITSSSASVYRAQIRSSLPFIPA
jgi:hypothetical protein